MNTIWEILFSIYLSVQVFLIKSILLTDLEFNCTLKVFLCPWNWLLIDFNAIWKCTWKFVFSYFHQVLIGFRETQITKLKHQQNLHLFTITFLCSETQELLYFLLVTQINLTQRDSMKYLPNCTGDFQISNCDCYFLFLLIFLSIPRWRDCWGAGDGPISLFITLKLL